ncbi:hypothetical protein RHODOSMS8_02009 [Rhodobiaceae bacterium]|nr:hypothetical protein RHODOSMS8_02009 [Rhodobiaceae bacterium]
MMVFVSNAKDTPALAHRLREEIRRSARARLFGHTP